MDAPVDTPVMDSRDTLERLRALVSGDAYGAGDRLPPERELIREFGVTRTNLRRAMETLENEGLIWRHVGKGTFVAEAGDTVPDGAILESLGQRLTPMKAMRARLCIEPAIAREAAINASGDAVKRLELAHNRARRASSWHDYEERDDQFHRLVAEASDNILLVSLFEQLNRTRRAVGWSKVVRASKKPASDHASHDEHARILAAIAARDPAAAQEAMRAHIGSVSARLFGEL